MNKAKQIALQTRRRFQTNDPYLIAEHMDIRVVFEPLGNILGYFSTYKRIPTIHINQDSGPHTQRFTCAHELGHRFLHPHVNVPFLRANTLLSVGRIEREANEFAVELLVPDELLIDGTTLYTAARMCGVPEELACLKQITRI